ncbi:MAG: DUF4148 domain-containing protein [Hydrogenophaga sp.]|nr:DUF4148 domain-containing protein [Hydrogenophaga sp.]
MKAALLPIAFALTAGAAFAEGPIFVDPPFTSTLSRAEVRAQAVAARDAGTFELGDGQTIVAANGAVDSDTRLAAAQSNFAGVSRTQVRAEAAEALRQGYFNGGEITAFPSVEQAEQVRLAGLRAAQGNAVVQAPGAAIAN